MFFRIVLFIWEFVLDLVAVMRMTEGEKDTVSKIKPQRQEYRTGEQMKGQNHALLQQQPKRCG
jgi:hypothetical protein